MPTTHPLRVLLLDVDPTSAARVRAALSGEGDGQGEGSTVEVAEAVADAVTLLARCRYDAVLVGTAVAADATALDRVRSARDVAALVVVHGAPEDPVPLDAQDVGTQTTLEIWTLDERALALTLQLAVERQRLSDAQQRAQEQAAAMARMGPARDPLTGLPCGERLLEEVDLFVADAIRFARPLTVAVVEVDRLSETRDAHGIAVADSLLIHAAGVMDQCLRTSDLLGRLDQDQLLVAMPGTSEEAAAQAASRIQRRLAEAPCRVGVQRHDVRTWIGLAALHGLMSVDELVFLADGALATARRAGQARIHAASAGISVG